jgi:hypothetical protein
VADVATVVKSFENNAFFSGRARYVRNRSAMLIGVGARRETGVGDVIARSAVAVKLNG